MTLVRRPTTIRVTDHAVLRWLEREQKIDVEAVREAIAEKVRHGAELGAIAVHLGDVKLVLRPDHDPTSVAVVTALPRNTNSHTRTEAE